jgi:hypothetical protein
MKLEQRRLCRVELTPTPTTTTTVAQLEPFLAKPLRPLRGLLDPQRLQRAGVDTYIYTSRPYGVAGWTLQPRVLVRARFSDGELLIQQLESRVDGLGAWQERLQFGLEARFRARSASPAGPPQQGVLEAEALVWAEVPLAAVAVAAPVLHLGLQQLLDRMERRCQQGLRRRAEAWLRRHA